MSTTAKRLPSESPPRGQTLCWAAFCPNAPTTTTLIWASVYPPVRVPVWVCAEHKGFMAACTVRPRKR